MFKFALSCLYCLMVVLLVHSANADDGQELTFPGEAMVRITRETNGESYIDLKFRWVEPCVPLFTKDQAVEFEVVITPKCFLRPKYGVDDDSNCTNVMGKYGFNLPNGEVTFLNSQDRYKNNCYVDVWNYWVPSPFEIAGKVEERCGELDMNGEICYTVGSIGAADKDGNFTVGLHDASKLVAGEWYSFRYPVEINDDPACLNSPTPFYSDPRTCEDPNRVVHNEWGRAYINMQVFNNKCDLNCDKKVHQYTCPEVIGIVNDVGQGCIDAHKSNGFWINRLCVPTNQLYFTPGRPSSDNGSCVQESNNSEDTKGHDTCCMDMDGDGLYATQGQWSMFGTKVGDCDDNNSSISKNCWLEDLGLSLAGLGSSTDPPDAGTDFPDAGGSQSCDNPVYLQNSSPECIDDNANILCLHVEGDNQKQWWVCPNSPNITGSYDYRLIDLNHPGVTVADLQISSDGGCTPHTVLNPDSIQEGPANSANLQMEIHFPPGCQSSDCTFYTGVINLTKVCP